MSKTITRSRGKQTGLTLVEIMVVLAIILGIAAAGVPAFQYARSQSDVRSIADAAKTIRSTLSLYELSEGYSGVPPLTELLTDAEATLALTGTMGGITANSRTAGTYFDFEKVLIGAKVLEAPLAIYNGTDSARQDSVVEPVWNPITNTFSTASDATPNYIQTNRTTLECALSTNMGAPTFDSPGRFTLTTGMPIIDHQRIVYWRIPKVPTSVAQSIAKKLNGTAVADNTAAQTTGVVNYPAPIAGATTVYVYIKHY
jgi:prepilin-type N-terminal cleavage/methylation domain-containing protein